VTAAAFNHAALESDGTALSAPAVQAAVAGAAAAVSDLTPGKPPSLTALRSGREAWRWLVLLALAVLVAEGLVAWRWATDAAT
jgi:hypothetical protein